MTNSKTIKVKTRNVCKEYNRSLDIRNKIVAFLLMLIGAVCLYVVEAMIPKWHYNVQVWVVMAMWVLFVADMFAGVMLCFSCYMKYTADVETVFYVTPNSVSWSYKDGGLPDRAFLADVVANRLYKHMKEDDVLFDEENRMITFTDSRIGKRHCVELSDDAGFMQLSNAVLDCGYADEAVRQCVLNTAESLV